jgi:hypothetical protein
MALSFEPFIVEIHVKVMATNPEQAFKTIERRVRKQLRIANPKDVVVVNSTLPKK